MINIEEIKSLIPQRYPFLMLDGASDLKEVEYVKAFKNVSINEDCFRGHFPGNPIFPGALIAEGMAQAACLLLKKSLKDLKATSFYVTNVKIRFFRTVLPGDRLEILIKTVKMTHIGGIFKTEASVDDNLVAKGEMTFACK